MINDTSVQKLSELVYLIKYNNWCPKSMAVKLRMRGQARGSSSEPRGWLLYGGDGKAQNERARARSNGFLEIHGKVPVPIISVLFKVSFSFSFLNLPTKSNTVIKSVVMQVCLPKTQKGLIWATVHSIVDPIFLSNLSFIELRN